MTTESVERPYGFVVIAASLLLMALGAGGYYVVLVGLKLVAEDFGGLRFVPSMAYSATVLGMGLGGIWIGRWTERHGVALPALLGSVMVALGALAASWATNAWLFLAAHGVLMGLFGNAALFSPLVANAARWFDRRRGMAVAVVTSAQGLAGFVWPAAFRVSIETVGWRQSYRLYAALAVVLMVPLTLVLRPSAPVVAGASEELDPAGPGRRLSPRAIVVLLSLAILGCCVAMAMPIVHVVAHATDLGHPLARAAELLAVLLGFGFFGRLAWGLLADRIGGLPVLLTASALQALVLSSFLFVEDLIPLFVVSALFGLAFGGLIPAYALVLADLLPGKGLSERIAVVYLFGALGMAVGGWLGGGLFDLTGAYRTAFGVGVAFNLMNLFVLGILMTAESPRLKAARA